MKNCLIKKLFQYQQMHSSTIMYFPYMVLKEFVNQFTMHGINNMRVKNYLSSEEKRIVHSHY